VLFTHDGMFREDDPVLPAQNCELLEEEIPPCRRHGCRMTIEESSIMIGNGMLYTYNDLPAIDIDSAAETAFNLPFIDYRRSVR